MKKTMIVIKSKEIKSAWYGDRKIKAIYFGDKKIWPSNYYLRINPEYIWLMPSNNFIDYVDVISNIDWNVE